VTEVPVETMETVDETARIACVSRQVVLCWGRAWMSCVWSKVLVGITRSDSVTFVAVCRLQIPQTVQTADRRLCRLCRVCRVCRLQTSSLVARSTCNGEGWVCKVWNVWKVWYEKVQATVASELRESLHCSTRV